MFSCHDDTVRRPTLCLHKSAVLIHIYWRLSVCVCVRAHEKKPIGLQVYIKNYSTNSWMWAGPVSMLRSVSSTLPTTFKLISFCSSSCFYYFFLNSSIFSFCMKGIWMYCEIWNCKIFSWQMFSNVFQRKKWIHCCIKTFEKGKDVWNSPRKSSELQGFTDRKCSVFLLPGVQERTLGFNLKKKTQRKLSCNGQIPEMIPNGSYQVLRTKTVCV